MKKRREYQLLDTGKQKKLERFGPYSLIRPCSQAVWSSSLSQIEWQKADAEFIRSNNGEGKWKFFKKIPDSWILEISSKQKMLIKLTQFGHIGVFPEHHDDSLLKLAIQNHPPSEKKFRLLNLFAYTGAISLRAESLGAQVTHVDASKTSVQWARENAELVSHKNPSGIRWIVDDVKKFCTREIRRKSLYEGIILDPPSFGRGPKGEIWKIEEDIDPFLEMIKDLRSENFSFIQLSSHSPGFTPLVLQNLLDQHFKEKNSKSSSFEMVIQEEVSNRSLPCGACSTLLKKT